MKASKRDIAEKALINYRVEMPACSVVVFLVLAAAPTIFRGFWLRNCQNKTE